MTYKILNYKNYIIRTLINNGTSWFKVADLSPIVKIVTKETILRKARKENALKVKMPDNRGNNQLSWVISEKGLLILLEQINHIDISEFEQWAKKVISTNNNSSVELSENELFQETMAGVRNEIIEITDDIKSKIKFADFFENSKGSISVRTMANLLCQNGFRLNQQQLFEWLVDNKYFFREGGIYNSYQKHIDKGYFEIEIVVINNTNSLYPKIKFTAKGIAEIIRRFNQQHKNETT